MRLLMIKEDLGRIPGFDLPPGFCLRWYQPGDEQAWLRIHLLADQETKVTPDLFTRTFGFDPAVLAVRQCYLLSPQAEPIGTATAWFDDHFEGPGFGRVHYVALAPEYQGRGLSKPLMTVICRRLSELGHPRAYLATSNTRPAAIQLYRRFGFRPWIRTPEEATAWREVWPGDPVQTTDASTRDKGAGPVLKSECED
jgi:GNAT superfamily N-acetyltransferase